MVWMPRKTMMGAGQVVESYVLNLPFTGTAAKTPNPALDISGYGNNCNFNNSVSVSAFYGADSDSNPYGAAYFDGTADSFGFITADISLNDIWAGGNFVKFDLFAVGYGGGNAGRIIDSRDLVNSYGFAIFIHNSSVALSFLIQDSTGLKFWRMDNPLNLSTWYSECKIEFNSDDKQNNEPIITIGGGGPEAITKLSDTTGGATGAWGNQSGLSYYVGNNVDGFRGFNGRIDNLLIGER